MSAEAGAGLQGRRPTARLALVSLALALLFVLHLAPLPGRNEMWRALSNALHAPVFALVAMAAMAVLPPIGRRQRERPGQGRPTGGTLARYAVALAATAVLAAVSELSQVSGSRTASLEDWGRDLIGAAAGLVLHASLGPRSREAGGAVRALIWTGRFAAIATLATVFLPAAQRGYAYWRRDAVFPVLGAFEARWETLLWSTREGSLDLTAPPPGWPRPEGERVARIRLEPGRYPGVWLAEPPASWVGYDALELSLYSSDPGPFPLSLRIHDAEHQNAYADRYNAVFQIGQGESTLRIALDDVRRGPRDRELDLSRIQGLGLFVAGLTEARTLYLDDVRLVASEPGGSRNPGRPRRG